MLNCGVAGKWEFEKPQARTHACGGRGGNGLSLLSFNCSSTLSLILVCLLWPRGLKLSLHMVWSPRHSKYVTVVWKLWSRVPLVPPDAPWPPPIKNRKPFLGQKHDPTRTRTKCVWHTDFKLCSGQTSNCKQLSFLCHPSSVPLTPFFGYFGHFLRLRRSKLKTESTIAFSISSLKFWIPTCHTSENLFVLVHFLVQKGGPKQKFSKVWHVGIQNLRLEMLNATVPSVLNLDPCSLRKRPK